MSTKSNVKIYIAKPRTRETPGFRKVVEQMRTSHAESVEKREKNKRYPSHRYIARTA